MNGARAWIGRTLGGGSFSVLLFLGASAAANERLPDWISVSPEFSTSVGESRGERFPDEEQVAAWERDGFGFVDLLWRIDVHLERSGMIDSRVEIVRHFLSESGVSQGGNLALYADAWRDRLTVDTGYSISPNSPPVFADPKTVEIVSDDAVGLFSDIQRVIIPVPGLRAGSNGVIVGTRRFQSADLPLAWSSITMLGNVVPVERIEIRASRDEAAPPFTWATNDPDLDCKMRDDRNLSCARSNVPAIQLDANMLSYSDIVPHLYIGAIDSWSGLQKKVGALVERSARVTSALQAKVGEIGLDPADTSKDKLWKLLRFVADEIRYVSLSHGDATVVPYPAAVTLSRRYGDCKDKVTLLAALAKVAGLDIVPVLVSSEHKVRENVLKPSSGYFDHMIACMDTEEGERLCVDPTQAYSGFEVSPQLAGAVSLRIDESGEGGLGNLESPEFGWEVHLQRKLTLERDASLSVRDVRSFGGPGAANSRSQILALSWADREAWLKRDYRDAHGVTDQPDFTVRSLRDAGVPYEIESRISSPGAYKVDSNQYYGFDPWLIYYARNMISTNRYHPYQFLGFRYTAEESIDPCCGHVLLAGPTLDFESKYGSLRRTTKTIDGRLVLKTALELPAAVIPVKAIPSFESFIMQSTRESAYWLSWRSEE